MKHNHRFEGVFALKGHRIEAIRPLDGDHTFYLDCGWSCTNNDQVWSSPKDTAGSLAKENNVLVNSISRDKATLAIVQARLDLIDALPKEE